MYVLLNLSHYAKSYGHLCQILTFFTMPALQIWPCHVTHEENFKTILFFPNSAINIGKSCKIYSRKLSTSEVISKKPHGGGVENSAFRVKANHILPLIPRSENSL